MMMAHRRHEIGVVGGTVRHRSNGMAAYRSTPCCRSAALATAASTPGNERHPEQRSRRSPQRLRIDAGSPCPSGTSRRWRRKPPPRARSRRHCPDPADRRAQPPRGSAAEQLSGVHSGRPHQRDHALAGLGRGDALKKRIRQHGTFAVRASRRCAALRCSRYRRGNQNHRHLAIAAQRLFEQMETFGHAKPVCVSPPREMARRTSRSSGFAALEIVSRRDIPCATSLTMLSSE